MATDPVTKKSGAAHMKSILSVQASQAMNLMIGRGPNANFKSSLFLQETGTAFAGGFLPFPKAERHIRPVETRDRVRPMTMLVSLGVLISAATLKQVIGSERI
ncbi:MAG TPA: hypothetical protein VGP19_02805 [Candidatus Acidoferrales bacterium]|nr:hypothetical protein [Candidatus Acidoferrales bacterium]